MLYKEQVGLMPGADRVQVIIGALAQSWHHLSQAASAPVSTELIRDLRAFVE